MLWQYEGLLQIFHISYFIQAVCILSVLYPTKAASRVMAVMISDELSDAGATLKYKMLTINYLYLFYGGHSQCKVWKQASEHQVSVVYPAGIRARRAIIEVPIDAGHDTG